MPTEYIMTTPRVIRNLLVTVFSSLSGLPEERVMLETMVDRRPDDGPFISIYIKRIQPMWDSVPYYIDGEDKAYFKGETTYYTQITFWGKDAFERAQSVQYMLNYDTRDSDLWEVIGGTSVDEVRDTSVVVGGHVLQKAMFSFKFYAAMSTKVRYDWFNKIRLELTDINQAAQKYNVNFDIEG